MRQITNLIVLLCFYILGHAQQMTQVIRGTITDTDTKTPLYGVTIQLLDSEQQIGAITDQNGNFRIDPVPVGRVSFRVSYLGYEERVYSNVLVGSAKEIVLAIELTESVDKLDEIVIRGGEDKSVVQNEMAMVSARSFSVDETQRYAGAINDPARMVSAFAGVNTDAQGNNDIVVRGNSPMGVLWRMEGVEIPNPNHFANDGASGGPISALSSNMLANSDFLTGAFSPEYGNALSGVFDIRLKKGNNEKRQYTIGLSTLGVDLAAEGPLSKKNTGSYLINYRYSTLDLLARTGVLDFGGVPRYQDLSFKIWTPISASHHLTTFGLLGSYGIRSNTTAPEDDDLIVSEEEFTGGLGTVGLSHLYLVSQRAYWKNTVAVSGTKIGGGWSIPDETETFFTVYDAIFRNSSLTMMSSFNYKVNAKHKLEVGGIHKLLGYRLDADEYNFEDDVLEKILDDQGSSSYSQLFSTWKYRISRSLDMVGGIHYLRFNLNGQHSLEPRLSLKLKLEGNKNFSIGYGRHSKLQSLTMYLAKVEDENGQLTNNKGLGLAKADHFILGYDQMLGQNTYMKVEAYYQSLFNIPIEDVAGSTYSILNISEDFPRRVLTNQGKGRNYGLEFTVERYFSQGFYYLTTLSLYKSLYTSQDGVERSTTFDGNYTFNFLSGKEFNVGASTKNKVLFINTKIALAGPRKYTPIDFEASNELGDIVRDETMPFSKKGDVIFKADLAFGIRRNKARSRTEWKFDIQNITNHNALVDEYYEPVTGSRIRGDQLPLLPTISYKIEF